MATKLFINFERQQEDGGVGSGPGNGTVVDADFIPNVGEMVHFMDRKGVVKERNFVYALTGYHGVVLNLTPTNE